MMSRHDYAEIMTAEWSAFSWLALAYLFYYLWHSTEHLGVGKWSQLSVQLVIAFIVITAGSAIHRTWFFWLAYQRSLGDDGYWQWMLDSWTPLHLSSISTIGLFCLVRVLSPEQWGHWRWSAPALYGLVVGLTAWWL